MIEFETRISARIVNKKGEPIFSEYATLVEIDDEAAGEFVKVSQNGRNDKTDCIRITSDEWPSIRSAINDVMEMCRGCHD